MKKKKKIKIILKKNIKNLGKKNKILFVKPGYARNYLFPKNIAKKIKNKKNNKKTPKKTTLIIKKK